MPARPRTKSPQLKFSPVDLIANEALSRISARTKPVDLQPDNPIQWIEDHFRIPREEREDMRIILYPYHKTALRHALSRDERGLFRYSLVLWSDIKKSIKSTIAAAVLLWRAWHTDYGQFYVIANTKDQADSRVAYYLRRAIELNSELKRQCNVNYSTHTVTLPNRSFIKAIPVNAAGEAGANPTMVEITELWGATSKEAQRMWTETTLPPALLGKAQRWIDTYAGFEGESVILEQLYDMGVQQGTPCDPEYNFMYENRPARMFTMWNQTPRLPWQTDEYYASEERTLLITEFLRVHRNMWSSGSERFVPKEWIEACRGTIPKYNNEPCVAALDGGLSDDSFALVVLDKSGELTRTRYARVWYPPLGGQIDFVGTLDNPGPELEVERLMRIFNIIEFCYDKTHIADMMARLNKRLGIHIYDFSQGELRLVADNMFRHSIRDKTFVHSGEEDLVAHIDNANAKITKMADASGNAGQVRETLRIVKRNQKLKIDCCVACSMANYELREAYNIA